MEAVKALLNKEGLDAGFGEPFDNPLRVVNAEFVNR